MVQGSLFIFLNLIIDLLILINIFQFNLIVLILIFKIKHLDNILRGSPKIWVISINIGILHHHQILDHLVCWLQAVHQESQHLFIYLFPKLLESVQLWHFYFEYDPPKLFKYKLHTL